MDLLVNISICFRSLELDALSSDGTSNLSRSFSVDSLMDDDSLGMVEDVSGYYEAQKNQIFIGMATLQYQARQVALLFLTPVEPSLMLNILTHTVQCKSWF